MRCPHCNGLVTPFVNPKPTVDIIIQYQGGIVLVERRNPPLGWALPGGFVDYNETLEQAAIREAAEETGLAVQLVEQMHSYSDPERDPRQHTISTVFIAIGSGTLKAGDDAGRAAVFTEKVVPLLVFDHTRIVSDYFLHHKDGHGE